MEWKRNAKQSTLSYVCPMKRTRRVLILSAASVAAALALFILIHDSDPTAALSRAILKAGVRPILLRVTGLPHGRAPSDTRSERSVPPAVNAAAIKIFNSKNRNEHATAIAALASGRIRDAITGLETLVSREPTTTKYWSDLAAARYEDARDRNDFMMYAKAFAAAERAVSLEPDDPEATFNRAASLEALGLHAEAAQARRHYLSNDSSSQWAAETRIALTSASSSNIRKQWNATLATLEHGPDVVDAEALTRRFPQQTRTYAEGVFLAYWADAFVEGNPEKAYHWLGVCRAFGHALSHISGERLLADAVEVIDTANLDKRERLAEAHRLYRDARKLYFGRDVRNALPLLRGAEQKFRAVESPMEFLAAYFFANALIDAHQRTAASDILSRLATTVPRNYIALRAQMDWLQGTTIGVTGRPFEALVAYRSSLAGFERLGENENTARMTGLCATTLASLGDDAEAWRLYAAAFRAASASGATWLIEVTLNDAARQEIAAGRMEVAWAMLRTELLLRKPSPRLHFDALMWLAFVESKLTGAPLDLGRARATAAAMVRGTLRDDAIDELRVIQALHGTSDPSSAIDLLSQSIEYRLKVGQRLAAVPTLIERARFRRAAHLNSEAIRDLDQAIVFLEATGDNVETTQLRDTYFGASRDAYEELTDLFVSEGQFERAFEVSDRRRFRVTKERRPSTQLLHEVQQRIPSDTVLLHYSVLPRRLFIVAIGSDRWIARVIDIARQDVISARDKMVEATLADRVVEVQDTGRQLYQLLISPVEDAIRNAATLVIAPDDVTVTIPFAALRTRDAKWICERVALAITPSAATYGVPETIDRSTSAAVIVDVATDNGYALPRLPSARRDGQFLSQVFTDAEVLTGDEATYERVRSALLHKQLIHLATHAISDSEDFSRSMLPLAGASKKPDVLYSHEIMGLDLSRAQLVVLAGCQTAATGKGRGSVRSLALAFLASGAASVVASLWNVDDEAISELTRNFYRLAVANERPTDALRHAQLEAIRSGRKVRDWAGQQIFVADR